MKTIWKKILTAGISVLLAVTSVSVCAEGNVNLIFGEEGSFETEDIRYFWYTLDSETSARPNSNKTSNMYVPDPEDATNTVLKIGDYNYGEREVKNFPAGRCKITLRFRGTSETSVPALALGKKRNFNGDIFIRYQMGDVVSESNAWEEYTLYLTVPQTAINDVGSLWITLGDYNYKDQGYYDDIRIYKDTENTVEFFNTKNFSDAKGTSVYQEERKFVYRGNSLSKISDAELTEDGGHGITTVAHYIPETENSEEFNLISAVYRVGKDGNKQLFDVKVKPASVSAGIDATISDQITVPKADDDYTYELKSFIWSSVKNMQAMSDTFILHY